MQPVNLQGIAENLTDLGRLSGSQATQGNQVVHNWYPEKGELLLKVRLHLTIGKSMITRLASLGNR